jgi:hypothetical protein
MGFRERYSNIPKALIEEETSSSNSIGSSPSPPKSNGPADAMSFVQNEVAKLDLPSSTQTNTNEQPSLEGPTLQNNQELQPKGLMDNLQTIKNEQEISRDGVGPTDNDIVQKQKALDNFRRRLGA